jgi:hypothetical protein
MGNRFHESSSSTTALLPVLTATAMKIRFKERCNVIGTRHRNWQIRVHRVISWLKRSDEFTGDQLEAKFLFLWIALNSLYSRWDNQKNMPGLDSVARDDFLRRSCEFDKPLLLQVLHKNRGLVKKLLENAYLAADFWRQPEHPKAKGWATADANYLDKNLKAGDACWVLTRAMQRLFIFRGQLVHGASSGGSRLNRGSMKYCLMALEILVPLLLHIVIEHGCGDDWPELCYPPLSS